MWTTPLNCLISRQSKCVRNVVYSDILTGNQNANNIEPVGKVGSTVSVHPHAGTAPQLPLLAIMHGLDRMPERFTATRLHLNERDFITAAHDQIDVAVPTPKPMGHKRPSVTQQPTSRDPLAL